MTGFSPIVRAYAPEVAPLIAAVSAIAPWIVLVQVLR